MFYSLIMYQHRPLKLNVGHIYYVVNLKHWAEYSLSVAAVNHSAILSEQEHQEPCGNQCSDWQISSENNLILQDVSRWLSNHHKTTKNTERPQSCVFKHAEHYVTEDKTSREQDRGIRCTKRYKQTHKQTHTQTEKQIQQSPKKRHINYN